MEIADSWLAAVAASTMQITEDGFYIKDGTKVDLATGSPAVSCAAGGSSPALTQKLIKEARQAVQERTEDGLAGKIAVLQIDPTVVARWEADDDGLLISPASRGKPAAGFLEGEQRMELNLCRQSTLYASLTSERAEKRFYKHNREQDLLPGTEAMLLSPNVCLFREGDGSLLARPEQITVLSTPVPVFEADCPADVQEKRILLCIRSIFASAYEMGYTVLIFGEWGCEPETNDPWLIARCFWQILVQENWNCLFNRVIFALTDKQAYAEFASQFIDDAWIRSQTDLEPDEDAPEADGWASTFTVLTGPFPHCNYTELADADNIGYCRGVLADGTPFVAEKFVSKRDEDGRPAKLDIAFMLPYEDEGDDFSADGQYDNLLQVPDSNVVSYHAAVPARDLGILPIGMAELGQEPELGPTIIQAERLVAAGLLGYTSKLMNGTVFYYYDLKNDFPVMRFIATLWEDGRELAVTPLEFRPFATRTAELISLAEARRNRKKKDETPEDQ